MTNINMFNNIYTPGVKNSDNVGGTNAANSASAGASSANAAQSSASSNIALAAADELMQQLIDDANATNTRTPTATVLQALREAGLPQNAQNISTVNALIENNMPIGRTALRSFFLQMRAYPDADLSTLIALNRSDIPVTVESVNTVGEFMNNGLIMTSDVNELADMVETLLSDPSTPSGIADSLRQAVFEAIYDSAQANAFAAGETQNAAGIGTDNAAATLQTEVQNAAQLQGAAVTPEALGASGASLAGLAGPVPENPGSPLTYRIVNETATNNTTEDATAGPGGGNAGYGLSGSLSGMEEGGNGSVPDQNTAAAATRTDTPSSPAAGSESGMPSAVESANEEIMSFRIHEDISGHNDYTFRDFDDLARALVNLADEESEAAGSPVPEGSARSTSELPAMPEAFRKLPAKDIRNLLKNALSLKPENLSKENIKALYKRTSDFFDKVKEATEQDPERSALHARADQASRDTSLLNALNRMYPHIELPLKLNNRDAEGGLYVYTNRNGHMRPDGHVTALLHLNMPNLGIIDIHLDLKDSNLGMNYYCEEDAGHLLAGDITSLRGSLEKMGYSVLTRFNPAGSATGSVEASLKGEHSDTDAKDAPERLSFDIRA